MSRRSHAQTAPSLSPTQADRSRRERPLDFLSEHLVSVVAWSERALDAGEVHSMTRVRVGALAGLLVGIGIAVVLTMRAASRAEPGGTGEAIEYFTTYALLLGMPVSLPASALMQRVPGTSGTLVWATLAMSLIGNWSLIGAGVAVAAKLFRRRPDP